MSLLMTGFVMQPIVAQDITLTGPTDTDTDVALSPTFTWTDAGSGAVSYDVEYSLSATLSPDITILNTTSLSATVSAALTPNTTYYWRVRAKDGAGVVIDQSGIISFTTTALTLTAPANAAVSQLVLPTLTWTDAGTSASYDVYIDTDTDFTGITPINVASASHTITTPLSLGTFYYWKVEAKDASPAVIATSNTFVFQTAVLSLTAPLGGATNQVLKPLLDWVDSGTGATHYDVTYDTQADFLSGSAVTVSDLAATDHQITTALSANTTYHWRVQGKDGAGGTVIATSSTLSFTTANFALTAPANAATEQLLQPALTWTDTGIGATSYDVTYDTQADFLSGSAVSVTGLTATNHTVASALATNTTYYWKVDARDASGILLTSSTFSFTTAAVILTAPANGATDQVVLPTLSWMATTGAATYDVYIDTDAAFTSTIPVNVATTSHAITTALAIGTTYHWKVEAKDGVPAVIGTSATYSFTTGSLAATAPADAATAQALKPLLDWVDSGTGATHYDVTYDTQADFLSGSAVTVSDLAATDHQITTALSANTTYHWRVQGKDGAGGTVIATSSTVSFTTASFGLASPSDASTHASFQPALTWTDTGIGATSYDVTYDTQADFLSGLAVSVTGLTSTSHLVAAALTASTTYHWKVDARDASGILLTSSTFTFTTGTTPDQDGVADATEDAAPAFNGGSAGDGNGDGVPDKNQNHVTSLPNSNTPTPGYATIVATDSNGNPLTISGASATSLADHTGGGEVAPPASLTLPVGLFSFTITGVTPGGTATVQIIDHAASGASRYWKYNSTTDTWSDFTANASFNGQVITLTLTDGGLGDNDGAADGTIVDPGAPVIPPPVSDGTTGLPANAIVQAGAFTSANDAFVGTYGFGVYKWSATEGWEQKNNGLTNHWVYGLVATTSKLYVGTWGGGIFESSDGGDTWTQSGLPHSFVRGLAKNSSETVYATGDFSEIWRLNGASWDSVSVIQEFVVEPWGLAIDPGDDNHMYAATRYGLYESTDGGVSWAGILTGQQTFSVEVHPTTRDVYVGTATGLVRRTHGGTTFDVLRTTLTAAYSIAFDTSNRLFVGYWGPPGVEVSTDGGTTWSTLTLTPPLEMAGKTSGSFRVVSVIASPFDGSLIVGTEDGGTFVIPAASSVDVEDAEVPIDFALQQNYPNPFNPETLIGYALPEAQQVRLAVYDLLGREVRILYEGVQQAGRHEVVFRANDLPSGVYVYRLEAAGQMKTRLLNLIK